MLRANFEQNYGFDPVRFFQFEKYLSKLEGITLYYGFGTPNTSNDTNKKVLLDLETPNFIYKEDRYNPEDFDAIFMLCPLSVSYLNWRFKTKKFHVMWFPVDLPKEIQLEDISFDTKYVPVFYTGHTMAQFPVLQMIDRVVNHHLGPMREVFNRAMSASDYSGFVKKYEVLGITKICIVHNVLHHNERLPNYMNKYMDTSYKPFFPWHGNPDVLCMPQLKSRVFEGAIMGCVLLVYKDEYNTMDRYFEEGKEFLYYSTEQELASKAQMILDHYEDYIPMAKAAQKKVLENYGLEKFVDFIVKTLKEDSDTPSHT